MKKTNEPRRFPVSAPEGIRGSQNRRVFCVHYKKCLQDAIDKNWKGMSCEKCELRNDKSCQQPSACDMAPTAEGYDPIIDVETDDSVSRLLGGRRPFTRFRY